jgi:hypothetical protein
VDSTSSKLRKVDPSVRTLKIEEDGDIFKGDIKPKIRLMGRWLARAGFQPGTRVCVTCLAPGIIELRSSSSIMNEENVAKELPDYPF